MDNSDVKRKMDEVIELVASDVATIRTGRATPGLVEDIIIEAYGGQSKLAVNELATISAPDNQTLIIDPFDKSIIGDIRKGIDSAQVGLNPNIDGEIIRITLPPMTTEDREKYTKILSQKLESGRVMIRQIRAEFMKTIKGLFEDKELTEDEKFNEEKRLQDTTDSYIRKIEDIGDAKRKELLQV